MFLYYCLKEPHVGQCFSLHSAITLCFICLPTCTSFGRLLLLLLISLDWSSLLQRICLPVSSVTVCYSFNDWLNGEHERFSCDGMCEWIWLPYIDHRYQLDVSEEEADALMSQPEVEWLFLKVIDQWFSKLVFQRFWCFILHKVLESLSAMISYFHLFSVYFYVCVYYYVFIDSIAMHWTMISNV